MMPVRVVAPRAGADAPDGLIFEMIAEDIRGARDGITAGQRLMNGTQD